MISVLRHDMMLLEQQTHLLALSGTPPWQSFCRRRTPVMVSGLLRLPTESKG